MPTSEPARSERTPCRKCGGSNVWYRVWESSDGAFEDYHYTCNDCECDWWIDGPDA